MGQDSFITFQLNDDNGNFVSFAGCFMGAFLGTSGTRAFCFDRSGNEYFNLPDLPVNRAGGGLVLMKENGRNTLIHAGGTNRDENSER